MIELFGSVLLSLCGLPETIKCIRTKKCDIGWLMLWMWLIGELALVIFSFQTKQFILSINYVANFFFVLIMVKYKFSSRGKTCSIK